jgi:hypothetical protein
MRDEGVGGSGKKRLRARSIDDLALFGKLASGAEEDDDVVFVTPRLF